jgi:hypothetical protein
MLDPYTYSRREKPIGQKHRSIIAMVQCKQKPQEANFRQFNVLPRTYYTDTKPKS